MLREYNIPLGDDATFVATLIGSAIFVPTIPIGFFASLLFSRTLAGRCGALTGFGVALIRYIFILLWDEKNWSLHRSDTSSTVEHNSGVWIYILFADIIGWFCFMRGLSVYYNSRKLVYDGLSTHQA